MSTEKKSDDPVKAVMAATSEGENSEDDTDERLDRLNEQVESAAAKEKIITQQLQDAQRQLDAYQNGVDRVLERLAQLELDTERFVTWSEMLTCMLIGITLAFGAHLLLARGQPSYSEATVPMMLPYDGGVLAARQYMRQGNNYLVMQADCNLVLYKSDSFASNNAAWSSGTHVKRTAVCQLVTSQGWIKVVDVTDKSQPQTLWSRTCDTDNLAKDKRDKSGWKWRVTRDHTTAALVLVDERGNTVCSVL